MRYSTERIVGDLTKALTYQPYLGDSQRALNLLHETADRLRKADIAIASARRVEEVL